VAVLVAKDRVRRLIAPASFDMREVEAALSDFPTARGGSDLPMAIAEALRLLDAPGNPSRDIIVLTDGQRFAWRPEEPARWSILRELLKDVARRMGVSPRIWAIPFGNDAGADLANASVGPLELSRGLITPHLPITVVTSVSNGGPSPLTRTAELLVDGQPVRGMAQVVGPIPPGGRAPLSFKTSIEAPGSHALTVRLTGGEDALKGDDESARAVEVTAALPVLLVDGEPGTEPLSGETDFLRAALAPLGAETLQIKALTVRSDAFRADDLKRSARDRAGQRRATRSRADLGDCSPPRLGWWCPGCPGRQGRRGLRQRFALSRRQWLAARQAPCSERRRRPSADGRPSRSADVHWPGIGDVR